MKNPGCLLETETEFFFEVWAAGLSVLRRPGMQALHVAIATLRPSSKLVLAGQTV